VAFDPEFIEVAAFTPEIPTKERRSKGNQRPGDRHDYAEGFGERHPSCQSIGKIFGEPAGIKLPRHA